LIKTAWELELVRMSRGANQAHQVSWGWESPTFPTFDNTRVTFRVRNLTDKRYATWSDPSYPDQIFLGAPRTYEIETSFKF
jgi:outer membrane receptor protein involved in Fe transport